MQNRSPPTRHAPGTWQRPLQDIIPHPHAARAHKHTLDPRSPSRSGSGLQPLARGHAQSSGAFKSHPTYLCSVSPAPLCPRLRPPLLPRRPRRPDSPRASWGRGAGRRPLRPAGVPARARGCFPCSGKVSGFPEKLQPKLVGGGGGRAGEPWRKVGKRREGRGGGRESPAPAGVFHVYKLTPPRPSRPAQSRCQSPGLPLPRCPPLSPTLGTRVQAPLPVWVLGLASEALGGWP